MERMNETLLQAWLRLTTSIVNSRIVPDMTYNESLICNLLYNHSRKGEKLTPTALCRMTGMLKSQMNRTLNNLEARGIVVREKSEADKRQVLVSLHEEGASEYIAQHHKILRAIDAMIERIGPENARQAVNLFTLVADNADSLMAIHQTNRKEDNDQ